MWLSETFLKSCSPLGGNWCLTLPWVAEPKLSEVSGKILSDLRAATLCEAWSCLAIAVAWEVGCGVLHQLLV